MGTVDVKEGESDGVDRGDTNFKKRKHSYEEIRKQDADLKRAVSDEVKEKRADIRCVRKPECGLCA